MGDSLKAARKAFASRDMDVARRELQAYLRRAPRHPEANELMAYVCGETGDAPGLERHLRVATSCPGPSATACYSLGVFHRKAGQLAEARAAFERALAIEPALFEALHELGRTLHDQGEVDTALACFDRALAIRGDSFEAHHNRGRALAALGRAVEALACYDRALGLNPRSARTWLNRGEALYDLGRLDAALESYAKARAAHPGLDEATANEAVARLAKGDYAAGWAAFEARWSGAAALPYRHARIPRWDGSQDLAGRTILVWCEQGYGDTIEFCRYVPLLAKRGARVVLEVQRDVVALLALNFDGPVVAVGAPLPPCDFQVPMLSLPHAFGTTLASVPAEVPYLCPDPDKVELWRARLGPASARPRVAVAISGRATYAHEKRRRLPLAALKPLTRHCDLFLVQKELAEDDRRFLEEEGARVRFVGDLIEDFTDGSAIVAQMDLVISIDTALSHVAGALAKPVWVLLSFAPDWRWMRDRADSPWYPTARIFRQREPRAWDGVLREVEDALAGLARGR